MLKTTAKDFARLHKAASSKHMYLPTELLRAPKDASSSWLNANFGWLPFLKDLQKFYELTQECDKRMEQLKRDNGRWIRRGGSFSGDQSEEVVFDQTNTPGFWPSLPYYAYNPSNLGEKSMTIVTDHHSWFSGKFKYYIPLLRSPVWKPVALAHLYGLTPSPSLIYELTPWSWLADWASNLGDVISNLSDVVQDQLVADYAFLMSTTSRTATYRGTCHWINGTSTTLEWTAEQCYKQRVHASAFGFGFSRDDLSMRQNSILLALGINKFR
jgi:hypothetical protein